jgi:long-chain acyl-CoA synthetase
MTMLYERWRQIARERANEPALREVASGRQWTFAELARLVEGLPRCEDPVLYPEGHSAGFILTVLQGWRDHRVLCPLEPGQKRPAVPLPPASCCHLKSTSATTGRPRLVAFRARQLAADAENIVTTMGLRPDWPNLGVISLAHSYGFSNLVMPLLLHGIPLILAPAPLPEAVRRAAAAAPALTLAAVPALWRAWHEARVIPAQTRLAISAGAPLPVALERTVFEVNGLKIHNFYGTTECGGIAWDAAGEVRSDDDYIGSALRNVQIALDADGCAQIISEAAGETYWPEPDGCLGGGRFQTGDVAELKNGRIYLRGRVSDQINVAGRKVAPATIEAVLREHEAVKDCLVFSVPSADAHRADLIVACVAASAAAPAEALRQSLLSKLPAWQVPREWWFVDSLGANARGKVSRAEWRRKFLERRKGKAL